MASGKITKRTVDALIASRSEGFLWDDGIKGFGAKITKSGAVSYILQFRMGGAGGQNAKMYDRKPWFAVDGDDGPGRSTTSFFAHRPGCGSCRT